MRGPFVRLFVHLVWATWDRLPLLTREMQPRVYLCIQSEAHRLGAQVIAIGGIEDHVHVLLKYPPSVSISDLLKQMKGVSSRLVNDQVAPGAFFKWQGAYGAFSRAERDVPMVRRYNPSAGGAPSQGKPERDPGADDDRRLGSGRCHA